MQAVGAIIGSVIMGQGQKKAAQVGSETQLQMFREGQEATLPFREAGVRGLEGMEALMSPEGMASFMEAYEGTPMYEQMLESGSENILKSASATGALRTGGTRVEMGEIAPKLMMQALMDQFGKSRSLATMGAGPAGQTAALAPGVGQNIAGLQSQSIANQANIYGTGIGELGGFLQDKLQMPTFGKSGSYI